MSGITPAELCPFIDYNLNTELNKFKTTEGDVVHNGAPVDLGLLNEKWEALALLPVHADGEAKVKGKANRCGANNEDEYYLITLSDNDFITDNGTSQPTFLLFQELMLTFYRICRLWQDPLR